MQADAWRDLLRDKSLQFSFPDAGSVPAPPPWIQRVVAFISQHFAWFKYGAGIILAGFVLFVGYRLWLQYRRRGTAPTAILKPRPSPAWQPSIRQARLLLLDADALAEQGRYRDAVHLLLLVSIQEIGDRRPGLVNATLTSREIARLDALSPKARDIFGAIALVVERCVFGGRALGPGDFTQCRAAFEQFTVPDVWAAA